jgi:nitrate reductase NapE component
MGNLLSKLTLGAAKETVDAVANVVDKFVQNPAEREAARAAIEEEISKRWSSDMNSDSWLSKNIRPLTLAVIVLFLISMTFFEGFGISSISERWIGLWEMVSVTVIGGYFAVRTVDKRTRKIK